MKGTILEKIIGAKRLRVEEAKKRNSLVELSAQAAGHSNGRGRFINAIADNSRTNIIAEFKRASPSKGTINDSLNPSAAATAYRDGGAAAISVLTEEDFFRGSIDDLKVIRSSVDIPILRKDFVFDEYQVFESAAIGADVILLIVAALDAATLQDLLDVASGLRLDVLVEVHNEAEMEIAAGVGAKLIGVNNRDLKTFEVSLDVSRRLIKMAPSDAILVSESGLASRNEILELRDLGFSGFLIGETLMRSRDPGGTLEKWI